MTKGQALYEFLISHPALADRKIHWPWLKLPAKDRRWYESAARKVAAEAFEQGYSVGLIDGSDRERQNENG